MTSEQSVTARIDAYIEAAPAAMQEHLRRMRQAMATAAPEAVEWFGYGLPGFKYLGRAMLYYGAAAKHYAVYGNTESAVEALKQDVKGLDISKGTIRFAPGDAFPEALIGKLVAVRVAEMDAAEAARKEKARARRKSKP